MSMTACPAVGRRPEPPSFGWSTAAAINELVELANLNGVSACFRFKGITWRSRDQQISTFWIGVAKGIQISGFKVGARPFTFDYCERAVGLREHEVDFPLLFVPPEVDLLGGEMGSE